MIKSNKKTLYGNASTGLEEGEILMTVKTFTGSPDGINLSVENLVIMPDDSTKLDTFSTKTINKESIDNAYNSVNRDDYSELSDYDFLVNVIIPLLLLESVKTNILANGKTVYNLRPEDWVLYNL